MRRLGAVLLVSALGFSAVGALPVRADDKKKTPEEQKQEKKDKDLKKAKEDMEKELKGKKVDPAAPLAMLDKLATQVGLEVSAAKDLVHKILSKKIPWDQANSAADTKMRDAIDTKTFKVDAKKFQADYTKWIGEWKAEPKDAPKK
jgi:hypothetical protein